ncbi:MAG: hypothetical protein ACE15E_19770 [Acidobacteriota bacterium]
MRGWIWFVSIILLAASGGTRGERWDKLYDQAKKDIDHQLWESAIKKLEQALAQKPDFGSSVTSQKGTAFPYFLMGKAYYHLGRYDEAARFFDREAGRDLPDRIATEIRVYQTYLRAIREDRKRLAQVKDLREPANPPAAASAKRRKRRAPTAPPQRSPRRNRQQSVQAVSDLEKVRRAVLAAYQDPPEEAVRMLQLVQSNTRTRNAELESSIGIAYARLSLLTVDALDSERFREKAVQHFRLALALDPGHKLNSRLVAPPIMDLFAASR